MTWTAIVPIKPPVERKSRLAALLSGEDRVRLSESMFRHVLNVLQQAPSVGTVAVLSAVRPDSWQGVWILDAGRGLNAELQAAADGFRDHVVVIHADLPGLAPDDVEALIDAAGNGVAIAPDRHRNGTNAVAVQHVAGFGFSFGIGSFARHRELAGERGTVISRDGLALDIDLPADFATAISRGFLAGWQEHSRAREPFAGALDVFSGRQVRAN